MTEPDPPYSPQFLRLRQQTRKARVSQSLTQAEVKQLAIKISPFEREQLLHYILKEKSFFKRSIIDVYILMACIKSYEFFNKVLEVKGEKALQEFCRHLYYNQLEKGKYLYEIGEVADKFYILMSGTVVVQVAYKEEVVNENGQVTIVQRMKEAMRYEKGQVFGETISKQSMARRAASIFTQTDCQFFEVKKKDYETVDKYMTISKMREKYMFFQQIDLFSRLNKTSLQALLYLTTTKEFHIGNVVYSEGQVLDEIYIVKKGQFKLESTIYGKQNEFDPLATLKARTSTNSRKFQTSIVGSKGVLGQIDALMDVPTKESCTCITQKAQIYTIQKKDLVEHIQESPPIDMYITTKYGIRNQRLKHLNSTFMQNSSLLSVSSYTKQISLQGRSPKSHGSWSRSRPEIRMKSEEDNYFVLKRNRSKKRSSIYSHHRSFTQNCESESTHIADLARITQRLNQKRRYSELRKNNDEPLFKFSRQIPIFLKVKLGLCSSTLNIPQGQNESSKNLTGFLTPKKLSQTVRPVRKFMKKQPRISANPNTIYGKFFQRLLDV